MNRDREKEKEIARGSVCVCIGSTLIQTLNFVLRERERERGIERETTDRRENGAIAINIKQAMAQRIDYCY